MESKSTYSIYRSIVHKFMDIIVLKHIQNHTHATGYDIIKHVRKRYRVFPSPGTIYSIIYTLERKNLIQGHDAQRRRLYKLTKKGEGLLTKIHHTSAHIHTTLSTIFLEK